MDKDDILAFARDHTEHDELNHVPTDLALDPGLAGMRIFDAPIAGFASADDPYFTRLLAPEVVGPHFRLPRQWLADAATVISFFFPFTAQIRKSNAPDLEWPSKEWMHGRIEGQTFLAAFANALARSLVAEGNETVVPVLLPEFWSCDVPESVGLDGTVHPGFTSNWSERHVAHVAGLGTFGLSAGLITAKGMAGRFISLVTSLALPPDTRPYQQWDEYCTHCGACVPRCTFNAISLHSLKNHTICGAVSARNKKKFAPWYGCGKCQVHVPCEARVPVGRRGVG